MKDTILHKLESLSERYEEVGHLLSDPEVIAEQDKFRQLSREYAELEDISTAFKAFQQAQSEHLARREAEQQCEIVDQDRLAGE